MIKRYMHGNSDTDKELFCVIGQWAVSEEVHKALGTPVTSRVGDTWYVAFDAVGPAGFCQIRTLNGGKVHLRYLFYNKLPVGKALVTDVLSAISKANAKSIHTNDRKTALIWEKFGFEAKETTHKGSFVRWEKDLV